MTYSELPDCGRGRTGNSACGARSINVALIGAAAALGAFPFGFDKLEAALAERLDAKFLAINTAALHYSANLISSI